MVVAVLLSAGDHVPVYPFKEVVGKALKVSPEQIGFTGLKVGVVPGLTVTVTVCWYKQVTVSFKAISSKAKSFP